MGAIRVNWCFLVWLGDREFFSLWVLGFLAFVSALCLFQGSDSLRDVSDELVGLVYWMSVPFREGVIVKSSV